MDRVRFSAGRLQPFGGYRQPAMPAFLTPSQCIRIMQLHFADVAELADAQVSEACDGDIVEVQVLSSAPNTWKEPVKKRSESVNEGSLLSFPSRTKISDLGF